VKKLLSAIIILLVLVFAGEVLAVGSCVLTSTENVSVLGERQRKIITFTCTSDAGGIATYNFVPTTFGVRGWYLYSVTTDPNGTSAPTDQYDITYVMGGEDIAGGLLVNRSSTLTQTVAMAPSVLGYHMADGTIVMTFANITAAPGIFVMTQRWTAN
jgi:hypothetical protein